MKKMQKYIELFSGNKQTLTVSEEQTKTPPQELRGWRSSLISQQDME